MVFLRALQNSSYLQRLVLHYGTTTNPYLGGFLLPTGEFLDFSQGGDHRMQDHRNTTWVSIKKEAPHDSGCDVMARVAKRVGMYRWMPEVWMLEGWTKPTNEQLWVLRNVFRHKAPIIEMHRGKRHFYREYEAYDRGQALGDLINFYT